MAGRRVRPIADAPTQLTELRQGHNLQWIALHVHKVAKLDIADLDGRLLTRRLSVISCLLLLASTNYPRLLRGLLLP